MTREQSGANEGRSLCSARGLTVFIFVSFHVQEQKLYRGWRAFIFSFYSTPHPLICKWSGTVVFGCVPACVRWCVKLFTFIKFPKFFKFCPSYISWVIAVTIKLIVFTVIFRWLNLRWRHCHCYHHCRRCHRRMWNLHLPFLSQTEPRSSAQSATSKFVGILFYGIVIIQIVIIAIITFIH